MKLMLTGAALMAASLGSASAQSSVSIDGFIDLALAHVTNKTATTSVKSFEMQPNGNRGSHLTFRGIEDLGGDLKAGFWLEHGFNPDDGTTWIEASRFWQRRATISLMGNWGELRLGRDTLPTFNNVWWFEPTGNTGIAQNYKMISTLGSNAQTSFRANNLVQYFMPNIGGFSGRIAASAPEGQPGTRYRGVRLGYASGAFDIAVEQGITTTSASTPDYKQPSIGASYDFGVVKLMGYVVRPTYGDKRQTLSQLGVNLPVTNGNLWALLGRSTQSGGGTDGDNATNFGIGYVHNLSKRTAAYATFSRINNAGNAAFQHPSGNAASALGGSSSGQEIGLRHAF